MKHPTNNEIWFAEQRDLAIEERDEERARADALAAEVADLSERHKTLTEKFTSLMLEANDEYTRRVAAEAEVERLTADVRLALLDAGQLDYELTRLGIDYDGDNPLGRLVEEVTALRAQLGVGEWQPVYVEPGLTMMPEGVPVWIQLPARRHGEMLSHAVSGGFIGYTMHPWTTWREMTAEEHEKYR